MESNLSKVVVITFDRWHAGFLGCYGNPWVDTPHLDELAVRGTVFDQHFAENLTPGARQHAWWTGRYQFPLSVEQQSSEPAWLRGLTQHNIRTSLLYDPAAATPLNPQSFTTSKSVSLQDVAGSHYQDDEPRFVRAAISRLKQMADAPQQSELLWIHAGGLPIDTPSAAYDELYSDGESGTEMPSATESTDDSELPDFHRFWRRQRASPRELADAQLAGAGWKSAVGSAAQIDWQLRRDLYSGQVTQWDAWLGRILQAVGDLRKASPLLLIFTAAAGEHLGEHVDIESSPELFEERIRVPLIVELPLEESLSGRRRQLTQDIDLPSTILDWLQITDNSDAEFDGHSLLPAIREDQPLPREAAFVGNSTLAGIRTADFYVRQQLQSMGVEPREMIFLKPDDRWDADNMLRQYVDDADELCQKWHAFTASIRQRNSHPRAS